MYDPTLARKTSATLHYGGVDENKPVTTEHAALVVALSSRMGSSKLTAETHLIWIEGDGVQVDQPGKAIVSFKYSKGDGRKLSYEGKGDDEFRFWDDGWRVSSVVTDRDPIEPRK